MDVTYKMGVYFDKGLNNSLVSLVFMYDPQPPPKVFPGNYTNFACHFSYNPNRQTPMRTTFLKCKKTQ